jgi:hypothetical protein
MKPGCADNVQRIKNSVRETLIASLNSELSIAMRNLVFFTASLVLVVLLKMMHISIALKSRWRVSSIHF